MEEYFSGRKLFGDNFSFDEIAAWYADEKEGYSGLGAADTENYTYLYHGYNRFHSFRFIDDINNGRALGFGSAYGDEFIPICSKLKSIDILDPSDAFVIDELEGVPVQYSRPNVSGKFDFPSDYFDIIVCFAALHHVPNVSLVISEMARVLAPSGKILIREPIVSMGDWRFPRRGLTKRERGIPIQLLNEFAQKSGLKLENSIYCGFRPFVAAMARLGVKPFNSDICIKIDAQLASMFEFNYRYHATSFLQKLRPTSASFVFSKSKS